MKIKRRNLIVGDIRTCIFGIRVISCGILQGLGTKALITNIHSLAFVSFLSMNSTISMIRIFEFILGI